MESKNGKARTLPIDLKYSKNRIDHFEISLSEQYLAKENPEQFEVNIGKVIYRSKTEFPSKRIIYQRKHTLDPDYFLMSGTLNRSSNNAKLIANGSLLLF